jgi:hypothetical protein
MNKLSLLGATAAIFLAGCEAPQKSHTWAIVHAVPHAGPAAKAPALEYARELHTALETSRVEHKIVTFKFRYRSRILLNREGEETAVIYRDPATPSHPWGLMSERIFSPVWLPTEPVASQVSFYVRRPATVVKIEDFPARHARKHRHAGRDGKSVVKPRSHPSKSKGKKAKGKKTKAHHRKAK